MRFRHVLRKNILYYLCGKFKHVTDGFHTRRAGGEGPRSVSAGIQLLAVRVFGLQRPAGGRIDTRCDDLGAAGRRHGTAAGGVRGCERHVAHRRFPRTLPRSGRPAGQSRDLRARTGVRRAGSAPRTVRSSAANCWGSPAARRNPCLRNGRPNITKSAPASNSSLVRPVLWGSTCNGRTLRRKSSCGRTADRIGRSSAIRHGFSSDFQSAGESGVYSAGKSRDSKRPSRHVSTFTPSR